MESPDTPPRRFIPRPEHHRPGSPAPWADLPIGRRTNIGLDQIRTALGEDGQDRLDQTSEPWRTLAADGRPAAVLVPLFEEDGETRVVLTVRSDQLRSHRGEVAFPGGRVEAGEDSVEAALREATEEVALDASLVTVIGQLTAMPTVASNSVMTPVVATLERRPTLQASPAEVNRIFDVSLAEMVADGAFHEEWWSVPDRVGMSGLPGGEFPVWFFDVADETVWGATGRTLMELICLVLKVPFPPSLRAEAPAG